MLAEHLMGVAELVPDSGGLAKDTQILPCHTQGLQKGGKVYKYKMKNNINNIFLLKL